MLILTPRQNKIKLFLIIFPYYAIACNVIVVYIFATKCRKETQILRVLER